MKHLYTYIILLFSTFSCSESLSDSVGHLIQYGLLEEDTIMLRRALLLTDSLINIESDKNAKKICYHNKIVIYSFFGNKDGVLNCMKEEALLSPYPNIDTYNYKILYSVDKNEIDSAKYYMQEAIRLCDENIGKQNGEFYAYYKVQYAYYLYGEKDAKSCLNKLLQTYKNPSSNVEYITSPFIERFISVTSSGLSSINNTINSISGLFFVIQWKRAKRKLLICFTIIHN